MAPDPNTSRTTRRKCRWCLAVILAIVLAAIIFSWVRPMVGWSVVAGAMGRQDTLHGSGRVYLRDNSEWDCALWAKVEGPGKTIPNTMVRPVRLPAGQTAVPERPDPMLMALGQAMDVCGEEGIITRLLASGDSRARGRRTEWHGKPAIMVEMQSPASLRRAASGYPDAWRFVVDPKSKLVLAVSMLVKEGGEDVPRGRCEYEYNAPLPKGFREQ